MPMPTSKAAKRSDNVRTGTRCCNAVPAAAPTAAGTPRSAAYAGSTCPWTMYVTTPAVAVIPLAARDVAVAGRSGQRMTSTRSGTITIPPPTPKSALKKPATSPISTKRTDLCYERGRDGRVARPSDGSARRGGHLSRLRRRPRAHRRASAGCVPAPRDAGRARAARRPLRPRRRRQRQSGRRRARASRGRRRRLRRLARARARPKRGPVAATDRRVRRRCGLGAVRDRAQGTLGRLPLPEPRGRGGGDPRAGGDRRHGARGGPRRALRAEGARGAAAGRLEQGNGRPPPARGGRPLARARRRRRHDRPRRVPRRRDARAEGARGRARAGVAAAPRRARRARARLDGRVPRALAEPLAVHVDEAVLAPVRARYGDPLVLRWEGEISDAEWALATHNPARTHDV